MKKKSKTVHPEWATKYRTPGTELRLIRGNYYLYGYKTIYDKEMKRPRKVSGKIIGTITQKEGLVLSEKRQLEKSIIDPLLVGIKCKEYGMSYLVSNKLEVFSKALETSFGDIYTSILAIAYCRFIYRCPLKNIPFRLAQSSLLEMLRLEQFNEKQSSYVLKKVGGMQQQMLSYMKTFIHKGEYMLIDATNILSNSNHISLSHKGYSSSLNFDAQFNLLYIYSADSHMPVYYRLLPGNIREVKAFKNSLIEAGLKKAVVIADKGFYSQNNITLLEQEKLQYVIPLKRDNNLVNYDALLQNTFKQDNSYFEHESRVIWYRQYKTDSKRQLFVYLDETLRLKEDNDYLKRIKTHPESYTMEGYHLKRNTFGTIALLTNIKNPTAENTYQIYKSRMSIEVMFDGMKNVLEADHTYMQDEQTLQGWMFINHIALQWYQHLYIELKEKGLLKKYSVNDYIQLLTDVKKIKINDKWYFSEITSYTQKLVQKIGIEFN
jgi:transposase